MPVNQSTQSVILIKEVYYGIVLNTKDLSMTINKCKHNKSLLGKGQ